MDPSEDTDLPGDVPITKIGLLMEAALTHQRSAEDALGRLYAHTQSLDPIVRDEIRRTLVDELVMVEAECRRASQALRSVGRAAGLRLLLCGTVLVVLCTVIAFTLLLRTLPTELQLTELRVERDRLTSIVSRLEARGGRLDLRRCGNQLCVRIDPRAQVFGEQQDYRVIRPD
jgi:hypothetical protein